MYPRWMYHIDFPKGKIFQNEQEEAEFGEGLVDTPALLGKEVEVKEIKKSKK